MKLFRFSVTSTKAKWRNMKDHYVKSVKEGKNGDPPLKRKRYSYMWSKNLEFLRDCIQKRPTPRYAWETSKLKDEEVSADSRRLVGYRKPSSLMSIQSSLLTRMDRVLELMLSSEDPDRSYLLPLLPAFRNLSEENKWRFQQKFVEIFISIEEA